MTSLREVAVRAAGRPDRAARRVPRAARGRRPGAPRRADSTAAAWAARQVTTGAEVELTLADGAREVVRATGVDPVSGALLVDDPLVGGRSTRHRRRRDQPGPCVGETSADGRPLPITSRAGCNTMARPAFRKAGRPEEAGDRRVVHLDRDRPLVEAAQADPARFEALYRKYVAQVYSYAVYELRDHHDAEDATERTFLAALAAPCPVRGASPARGRRRRLHLPRLAVPASPATSSPSAAARRRRRPEASLDAVADVAAPLDLESDVTRRDEARAALGRDRPAVRRPSPRADPALRRRDVDRGDRRRPRPVRRCGPRAHPSGAAQRRARPRRARAVMPPEAARDATEIEALVTDRYLETLLAAHASGADLGAGADRARPGRSARCADAWRAACRAPSVVPLRGGPVRPADRGRPRAPPAAGRRRRGRGRAHRRLRARSARSATSTIPRSRRTWTAVRSTTIAALVRPAAHRRRADLGGDLARRGRLRRVAACAARRRRPWPARSAPIARSRLA